MSTSAATGKQTESGLDKRYMYAVSAMQGWRLSKSALLFRVPNLRNIKLVTVIFVCHSPLISVMQDAHTAMLALEEDAEMPNALFAVYDGHGRA
jgi:protein phosphatase 2C family protein 2/3